MIFLQMRLTDLSCVDSEGQNKAFLLLFLIALVFFSLFIGFLGGLSLLLRSWWYKLFELKPRLFSLEVFHRVEFRLRISLIGAGLVVAQKSLVYFFDKQGKLQTCLGFGINRFFDYIYPIAYLLSLLLYSSFD